MKFVPLLPRHLAFLIIIALAASAAGNLNVLTRSAGQPQANSKTAQEAGKVPTNLANTEFAVYQKKDAQMIAGLKKNNVAVFLDGVQKEITSFSTPDRPITAALVVEYSKLGLTIGDNGRSAMGLVTNGVIEPAGLFLSQLIKSPNDYASVVAFDIRPTPITDLTNDPKRIDEAVSLLLQNTPAFRESALFDALRFVLIGGRGDAAVLDKSKARQSDYAGLASVQGKRKAIILIASGWDSFSKTKYTEARKIFQNAGVPIYFISTVGVLKAKRRNQSSESAVELFMQGEAQLQKIALETGGAFYSYSVESEVPGILEKINAMLRNQYGLAFEPGGIHDGKAHKIVVKVDVDGDGVYDEQTFVVQARQVYNAPKN